MTDSPVEEPAGREPVVYEKSGTVHAQAAITGRGTVERGLNDLRLAVLGILVTIGLTVLFGVEGPWWERLAWGIGSFAAACFAIWWRPCRHLLLEFTHRLTTP